MITRIFQAAEREKQEKKQQKKAQKSSNGALVGGGCLGLAGLALVAKSKLKRKEKADDGKSRFSLWEGRDDTSEAKTGFFNINDNDDDDEGFVETLREGISDIFNPSTSFFGEDSSEDLSTILSEAYSEMIE